MSEFSPCCHVWLAWIIMKDNWSLILIKFSLKTSFMKWKPDYDSAASEYSKAGDIKHTQTNKHKDCCTVLRCLWRWWWWWWWWWFSSLAVAFKNAKQLEQAKEAYLQEAEAHTNHRSYPSAWCWCSFLLDLFLYWYIDLLAHHRQYFNLQITAAFFLDSFFRLFHAAK